MSQGAHSLSPASQSHMLSPSSALAGNEARPVSSTSSASSSTRSISESSPATPAEWDPRRPSLASANSTGTDYLDPLTTPGTNTHHSSRRPSAATARSGTSSLFSASSLSLASSTHKTRSRNASAVYGSGTSSPPASPGSRNSSRRNILRGTRTASAEHEAQSAKWKSQGPSTSQSKPSLRLKKTNTHDSSSHRGASDSPLPSPGLLDPMQARSKESSSGPSKNSSSSLLRPVDKISRRLASADSSLTNLTSSPSTAQSSTSTSSHQQDEEAAEWAKILAQRAQPEVQPPPSGMTQSKSATFKAKLFGSRKREKSAPTSVASTKTSSKGSSKGKGVDSPSQPQFSPLPQTTSLRPPLPSPLAGESSSSSHAGSFLSPDPGPSTESHGKNREADDGSSTGANVNGTPRSGSVISLSRAGSWPPNGSKRSSFVSSDKGSKTGNDSASADKEHQSRLSGYRFENAAAAYGGSLSPTLNKRWGLQPAARNVQPASIPAGTALEDPSSPSYSSADSPHGRRIPPAIDVRKAKENAVPTAIYSASFLTLESPAQSVETSHPASQGGHGSVASSTDSPLFSQLQPAPLPPSRAPSKPERRPPKPPSTAPEMHESSPYTQPAPTGNSRVLLTRSNDSGLYPLRTSTPPIQPSTSSQSLRSPHSRRPASSAGSISAQSGDFAPPAATFLVHVPRSSSLRSSLAKSSGSRTHSSAGDTSGPTARALHSSSSSREGLEGSDIDRGNFATSALGLSSPVTEADVSNFTSTSAGSVGMSGGWIGGEKTAATAEKQGMTSSVSRLAAMFGGQFSRGSIESKSQGSSIDESQPGLQSKRNRTESQGSFEPPLIRRGSETSVYEDARPTLDVPASRNPSEAGGLPSPSPFVPSPKLSPGPSPAFPDKLATDRPLLPAKSPLRPNREWTSQNSRPAATSAASHDITAHRATNYRLQIGGASASTLGHGHSYEDPIPSAPRRVPERQSADDLALVRVNSPLRPSIERAALVNGTIPMSTSAGSSQSIDLLQDNSSSTIGGSREPNRRRSVSSGFAQAALDPASSSPGPAPTSGAQRIPPLAEDDIEEDPDEREHGSADLASVQVSPSKMKSSTSFGQKTSKTMKKATAPGLASAFKARKFSIGAKDGDRMADASVRSKRWPFGKDVLSDTEEDGAAAAFSSLPRSSKRSIRKKSGEPTPRLEIRRVFEPPLENREIQIGSGDGTPSEELPGRETPRRRMPSGRSAMPLNNKPSTASFASAMSADSRVSSAFLGSGTPVRLPGTPSLERGAPSSPSTNVLWTKDDLDEGGKRVYKRRNIIRELVQTEQSYASDLAIIRDVYLANARRSAGVPPGLALWSTVTGISPAMSPSALVHTPPAMTGATPMPPGQPPRGIKMGRSLSSSQQRLPRVDDGLFDSATPSPGGGQVSSNGAPTGWSGLGSAFASPALSQATSTGPDRGSVASSGFPNVASESNRSSVWTSNSVGAASGSHSESKSGSKSDLDSASTSHADAGEGKRGRSAVSAAHVSNGESADVPSPASIPAPRPSALRNPIDASTPSPASASQASLKTSTRPTIALETRIPSHGSAQSAASAVGHSTGPVPFTVSEMRTVFAGVEMCAAFASELSIILENAMGSLSSQDLPADPRDLIDKQDDRIGQALCQVSNHIRAVYSGYCSKHEASIAKLQQLSKSSITSEFLKDCTEIARRYTNAWDLASLLIKPVQRMLKYPLLLQEVVAATSQDHPDYASLVAAVEEMQAIADFINELNRRRDIINQIVSGGKSPSTGSPSTSKAAGYKTLRRKAGTKSREKLHTNLLAGPSRLSAPNLDEDAAYLELLSTFMALEREIPTFAGRCLDWSRSIKQVQIQQIGLLRQWISTYSLKIPDPTDDESEAHHSVGYADSQALRRFASFFEEKGELLCAFIDSEIRSSISPALSQVMTIFDGPRAYIEKRNERQDDYNKCRLSPGKVNDRKLVDSANGFVALHSQLLDELPAFLYGVRATLDLIVASFSRVQAQYSSGMKEVFDSSFGQMQTNGTQADPNNSMGSSATTVITISSAREIIQNWWNAHQQCSAAMEDLSICSREPVGRQRAQSSPSVTDATHASPQLPLDPQGRLPNMPRGLSYEASTGRRPSQSNSLQGASQSAHSTAEWSLSQESPTQGRKDLLLTPESRGPSLVSAASSPQLFHPRNVSLASSNASSAVEMGTPGSRGGSSSASGHPGPGLRSLSGSVQSLAAANRARGNDTSPAVPDKDLPRYTTSHGSSDQHGSVESEGGRRHQQRVLPTPPMLPTLDLGEEDLSPDVSKDDLPQRRQGGSY